MAAMRRPLVCGWDSSPKMVIRDFHRTPLDRRLLLKAAGMGFAAMLSQRAAEATERTDALFASAFMGRDGRYGFALLTERGEFIWQTRLPDRGHDAVVSPDRRTLVVFARRPGTFAMAIDLGLRTRPVVFSTPADRHFYGHGTFSDDGRLLYTTENDFDKARGVIGIYDATNSFSRIGELASFGVGPHEIVLMPDGKTLVVANGGIETHPDFGRAKLNLADMRPSLALVDSTSGHLIEIFELPNSLHQLSVRHMDVTANGKILFGCQDEGHQSGERSLIGWADRDQGLSFYTVPAQTIAGFRRYIGSVCLSSDDSVFAVSSPKGNIYALFSTETGNLLDSRKLEGVCGLARSGNDFFASSAYGHFAPDRAANQSPHHPNIAFDNHLTVI